MTVIVRSTGEGLGRCPMRPAANRPFCSFTALARSETVIFFWARLSGWSQMRIE